MIVTRVRQTMSFYDLRPGQLFQFQGKRATYVTIDQNAGTYRGRRPNSEVLTIPHNEWRDLRNVTVVEAYSTSREPSERSIRAYRALVAKAIEIGWPEHFADDLYFHDRITLIEHDPEVFAWSVRNTGTEIMIPNRTHSIFLFTYFQRESYPDRSRHRFYFWNGHTLKESSLQRIENGLLKASTPKAREFARQAWHTKNSTVESIAWQKQIDAELSAKAAISTQPAIRRRRSLSH
ncbi:MAG: hypothetical protein JNL58_22675 [Planctomyces sp.]|nr:hypothetical protein [Planctomyces sp.]